MIGWPLLTLFLHSFYRPIQNPNRISGLLSSAYSMPANILSIYSRSFPEHPHWLRLIDAHLEYLDLFSMDLLSENKKLLSKTELWFLLENYIQNITIWILASLINGLLCATIRVRFGQQAPWNIPGDNNYIFCFLIFFAPAFFIFWIILAGKNWKQVYEGICSVLPYQPTYSFRSNSVAGFQTGCCFPGR